MEAYWHGMVGLALFPQEKTVLFLFYFMSKNSV